MSRQVELNDGDTAVIIRHDKESGDQYSLSIQHYFDEQLDDETKLYYHVLARGMCAMAVNDPEQLFEHAAEADISTPEDNDGGQDDGAGTTYGNA